MLLRRLKSGRRTLINRDETESELDEEMRFQLEREIMLGLGSGMTAEEGPSAAGAAIGGIDESDEQRGFHGVRLIENFLQDLRYSLRLLTNSRTYTAVAIISLALGIGANTTMFSVLNAVLLRPLPYASPEQLVLLFTGTPSQTFQGRPAYGTFEEWQRHSKSFADMAVLDPVSVTLSDTDGAQKISVARVSPNFFGVLGIQPVRGRTFSSDEAEQRRNVALISHRFWQTHFGASADAIGAFITVDGLRSQVIGILPPNAQTPIFDADVWQPQSLFSDWEARRSRLGAGSWFVVGRLQEHVTIDQAQAEMNTIARVLDDELPGADRNRGISLVPLGSYMVEFKSRLALWMLMGAVFCVLLIAAANVASLSLARSINRRREMAIRAALGASPVRIVRQLLTEGVTLAGISGVLGIMLAVGGIRLARSFGPADLARLNEVNLDLYVLSWALVISLLTGILISLAPTMGVLRRNLRLSGEEGGRSVAGGVRSRRLHRTLVGTEFALAIILMASAGLLIRSWRHILTVDPGFRPERVISMQLSTPAPAAPEQSENFYVDVLRQVESLPGVEAAGVIGDLFTNSDNEVKVTAEGGTSIVSERMRLRRDEASDNVFSALRTPLLGGRFFSREDRRDTVRVAIINEAMARRLWYGHDPVGKRFKLGDPDSIGPWFTVVGVVGNMRRRGPEIEPIPQMFEPLAQNPSRLETLLVRTTSATDPLSTASTIRAAIRQMDKNAPVYGVTTLENRLQAYLAQRRLQTLLLVGFSLIALLLAAIGIYGLIHYSVAMRTPEIGLRMALGAKPVDILFMVMSEGLSLSLIGLVLGLVGALLIARAASSLLFGVTATDPLTLITVSLLLTLVAGAASYFPARRAAKVDPLIALRHD